MLQVTEWCFSAKASDGSSSREDLSSQLFRRNEHIRKLEFKLSGMCLDTYKPLLLEEISCLNCSHLLHIHGLGFFENRFVTALLMGIQIALRITDFL